MLPSELKAGQFSGYPPEARKLATDRLALLRQLPVSFAPLLLREVISYDWKFPVERKQLDDQLAYLASLSSEQLTQSMAGFARLRLPPELDRVDWVNEPGIFSEQLTAHLWATHQIDAFRAAAIEYVGKLNAANPAVPVARVGIVVVGQGVAENRYPLFRKLRPHGVHYKQVKRGDGFKTLLNAVEARASGHPVPYGHWYIDGGAGEATESARLTSISYNSLTPVRAALLHKMRAAYESGSFKPEALRTMLAQMRPEELGMSGAAGDAVINHFQVSLLTEGSGTQIFSTTFVQWAAREVWRRAQPMTLLARFAPRQRERPMNELLSGTKPSLDPEGSLIDADMGAYYTWLNQQRLSGADQSSFLAWFEDHEEALVIGPSLPRATEDSSPVDLESLVNRVAHS